MIIAITGILGSGKTTVSNMFRKKGAFVVDADRIGWKVLESKKATIEKVFGSGVFANGKVSRAKLRKMVFNDNRNLNKLNRITHPSIRQEIKKQIKKKRMTVIDVALYDKLKIDSIADKKIIVDTDIQKICSRLEKKYKKEEILGIIRTQKQSRRADFKVDNNFSIKYTEEQVNSIFNRIK